MRNYKEDIKVDLNALDEEWEKQTMLYDFYASREVEAEMERDKAKRRLEIAYATMDEKVRLNPLAFGLEEIKEAAVKAAVLRSKEVGKAEEEFLEAKKKHALAKIATTAIAEQKKKALTKATDLFIAGYYTRQFPKKIQQPLTERKSEQQRKSLSDNQRLRRRMIETIEEEVTKGD